VLGNETGFTIEVVFRNAVYVESVSGASVDHFWHQFYIPAYSNTLPSPIIRNPHTRQTTPLPAIKPTNHTMHKIKRPPIIPQSGHLDTARINHFNVVAVDFPVWIVREEGGVIGAECVDCSA